MGRIHCTVVEATVMRSDVEIGSEDQTFLLPPADESLPRGRFDTGLQTVYSDLLPWADPYIASLVHDLQVATGARLPESWPRGTAPDQGHSSWARSRDQRWPDRFGSDGNK